MMKKFVVASMVGIIIVETFLLRSRTVEYVRLLNENGRLNIELQERYHHFVSLTRLIECCSKKKDISIKSLKSFFSKGDSCLLRELSVDEYMYYYSNDYYGDLCRATTHDKVLKMNNFDYLFLFKDSVFVRFVNPIYKDTDMMIFDVVYETDLYKDIIPPDDN